MKTELKYGVLFATIVVVYVLIEHILGINTTRHDIGQYSRLAGVLVPILGIFFGIQSKRNHELNGIMTFGQGVKTGFLIAVIQTTLNNHMVFVLQHRYQSTVSGYDVGIREKSDVEFRDD